MCDVDDHAAPRRLQDHLPTEVGESLAADAVKRAAQAIVEEVGEADDAEPEGVESLQVRAVALQRVAPLEAEDPAWDRWDPWLARERDESEDEAAER